MLIKCGSVDVTNRVLSCIKKGSFSDKRIIGQVPSFQLELKLNNKDDFFNDQLNELFYYTESGSTKEYVFVAYEKPERYTKELSLKLYDRSYELDVAYATQLDYVNNQVTILDQLSEIEQLTGFSFDIINVPTHVLEQIVKWYDNTIPIRNYLGWIAELFAANVFAEGANTFQFVPLSKVARHKTAMVSDYQKDELFTISRVCFDNSAIKAEKGSTEHNTLYISNNNLYVDDDNKDSIVSEVYNVVKGLSVYSLKSFKTKNIVDLMLGDIINYNDEFHVMVLDISSKATSLATIVQNLKGEMVSKNEEKQVNRIDNTTRIRALRVVFDQEKLKWSVTAQEVEGQNEKIGDLEVDINSINGTIKDVKDTNEGIIEQTNELKITVDSLTNKITTVGGSNLIKDSLGVFGGSWISTNDKKYSLNTSIDVRRRNLSGIAILLNADTITQSIQLPDGAYTLSFSYCKHVSLASVKVIIDTEEFVLRNLDYTAFKHTFNVTSGSVQIQFVSDTKDSCTIVNLMLNQGSEASLWSLSQGESYSANFQISKDGATVSSSVSDVVFNMKNDVVGFKNKNTEEYITNFTDVGIDVKEITVTGKARIIGLLFQEINGQVVVNKLGR